MKKFISLLLMAFLVLPLSATTVKVNVYNFTSQPTQRRVVTVTLLQAGPVVQGPWLIAGDKVSQYTDTNGVAYFSNMLAAAYRLDISGSPTRSFPMSVWDTNAVVDATTFVNNTNAIPNFYTATQVDSLIADQIGGTATNVFVGVSGGLLSVTTNNPGSIYTVNLDSNTVSSIIGGSGASGQFVASSGRLTAASNELAATTIIANAVQASTFSGSGAALTSLNGSQISSGTVPEARLPNIVTNQVNYVENQALFINKDTGGDILSFNSSGFLGTDEGLTTGIGIKSTAGFEGPAIGLTLGTPSLATNYATATDGMVLAKAGNRLILVSVGGGGDLLAANNLAELTTTKALARKNLGTDDAASITNGVLRLASVPSLPALQTTNSAKFSDWNMWTDGATYFAQNKTLSSTLTSNNFSGLLQTVASSAVTAGISTRITVASGTDASASSSNRYYWFTNTVVITNGVIFVGAGNAATIFAASPALTGPLIQVGADFGFISGIVRFEHIRFHGDAGAALSVGLKLRNVAEPNVSHCEFNGFQLAGIQFNNTNYNHWSQILDTWFVGGAAGSHCILVDAAPAAVTCDLDISRCKFEPHGGAGITVSNHFRNIRITDSRFGDSSGNSTAPIQIYAGNGYTIANNMFYPYWLSAVPLIRFGDRASATNINALVANNVANGFTPNNMVWVGTNVQGVSLIGNVNPGGNIVTNGSGGLTTYARIDRELIRTDGDITAGGAVSGATATFGTQSNTVLNVGSVHTVFTNAVLGTDANGFFQATNVTSSGTGSSNLTDVATSVYVKGAMLFTNLNGGLALGRTNAVASSNVFEVYSGSTLQSRIATNGTFYGLVDSTNILGQTGVLAPTSAATNYTVALLPGSGNDPLLIYSANTNLFITFTGTNTAFVNRSIIIDSLSNTVSGYIRFASPVKTNFNFVFAYTNGQSKVLNFYNPDTRGTNVLVSDGGYYRGNFQ